MAFPSTNRKLRELDQQMRDADSYAEWRAAAIEHDDLSGMSRWRQIDQTSTYDHVGIRSRLDRLRSLRAKQDRNGLLFALNEGIHGNMGGMGKPAVHARARFGTKRLIEDYIDEICESLQEIFDTDERIISFEEKLDFFKRASRCYGRTALMLSGAGALGHFHAGVAKALVEQDVLPSVISGSSAGSITAAVIGTQPRNTLLDLFLPNHLSSEAQREIQLLDHLIGAQIDVRELQLMVDRLIPDLTFAEAFDRTGIHINVSIAPAERHQTSRLLNAVTSPNVYVRKAVMASCAVPGVYPPVTLAAKNVHGDAQPYLPGRKWIDGSVTDDMPAKRLARLYGVNHYIASQVNPIALPFVHKPPADGGLASIYGQLVRNLARESILSGRDIARRYAGRMPRTAIFMNLLAAVASQSYTADINIFPSFRYFDPRKLLSHLSEEEILALLKEGERATWPNIERIRISSKISHRLDIIMETMRGQESARLRDAVNATKRIRQPRAKATAKSRPSKARQGRSKQVA